MQSRPEFRPRAGYEPLCPATRATAIHKVRWTDEEDARLRRCVEVHGTTRWVLIASEMPERTGKQCRERWTSRLDPTLNHDDWTPREDAVLLHQQRLCGNCWAKIASSLPRRSPNAAKNRWAWLTRRPPTGLAQHAGFPGSPLVPRLEKPGISISEWSEALEPSQGPEWMRSDRGDTTEWLRSVNECVRYDWDFGFGWVSWE
jgi:hypothetical protein